MAYLESKGETWETDLNTELNAAQRARKQPVEDGYAHHVVIGETRARLHMVPFTARAQAHEATHQSILKQMKVGDVEKAQGVPEALAERSNESRERRAALMAHVRAFTNA
ncbi:hypothetical protein [Mycolicibacterium litorale]|uniref:hypothetical protein n=1 Tax=Mycolicibacterium litorale TaxID=758802 RepID=UPI00162AD680|nr:hypothetical protein [Mycolicibacterium litorale]